MTSVTSQERAEAAGCNTSRLLAAAEQHIYDLRSKGDAVIDYARHEAGCKSSAGAWMDPIPPCDCGYAQALSAWMKA